MWKRPLELDLKESYFILINWCIICTCKNLSIYLAIERFHFEVGFFCLFFIFLISLAPVIFPLLLAEKLQHLKVLS